MNARFLGTFCAVARIGSLTAAARHLGLSSASVGEQIKVLEKDLNAQLVSRHGRGIVLTEAGHAVLPAARDVLERIDEMSQIAQLGQARGRLRVGAVSTAMIGVLPPALQHMARHYPNIELNVYPGSSTHLYHQLEQGDLDCVISGRPSFALPKSMTWYPIREEPLVLLCPAGLKAMRSTATSRPRPSSAWTEMPGPARSSPASSRTGPFGPRSCSRWTLRRRS